MTCSHSHAADIVNPGPVVGLGHCPTPAIGLDTPKPGTLECGKIGTGLDSLVQMLVINRC